MLILWALTPPPSTVVPKKYKIVPALMDIGLYVNPIRHMLSVFASFCALISVEYKIILINKTNVCVLIFCDLPA
jgi:hypothetical protein